MQYTDWYGYRRLDFKFEDRDALIVLPNEPGWGSGKWACKMEYFGAFPALECDLLKNGFHLAYLKNINRWGVDEDHHARARFAEYLAKEYGLEEKFIPVGMSCGGLHSVNFASRYPDLVSVLYLDAPVMNLLSCPMGFGIGESLGENGSGWQEIIDAYGFSISELLTYREHPIDRIPVLLEHKLPVALIYGDSDPVVPYVENGRVLEEAYREAGLPLYCVGKPGCAHHPHGLEDREELLAFIRKYC